MSLGSAVYNLVSCFATDSPQSRSDDQVCDDKSRMNLLLKSINNLPSELLGCKDTTYMFLNYLRFIMIFFLVFVFLIPCLQSIIAISRLVALSSGLLSSFQMLFSFISMAAKCNTVTMNSARSTSLSITNF